MNLEKYVQLDTKSPRGWCEPVWENYEEFIAMLLLMGCKHAPGELLDLVTIDMHLATQLGLETCNLILRHVANPTDRAVNIRRVETFLNHIQQEKLHETDQDQSPTRVP